MKKVLVCGAGGFIGGHLVERLRNDGSFVRGVDIKQPEFRESLANEFLEADLRDRQVCARVLQVDGGFDEVYQLAADMGGMGFIHTQECEIMRNNALINLNMVDAAAAAGIPRYFFSSSVCIYRDMENGEAEMTEAEAYPALPDNEYGWEKLYAERVVEAYGRRFGMAIRIARFQNCYGPFGTWNGDRAKAPAALCRKVAEVSDGDAVDVWGNGSAVRSYIYVADMVDAIVRLTSSSLEGPVNVGSPQYVDVDELVETIAAVAGKNVEKRYVDGPIGVQSRNFSNARIESLGWRAQHSLHDGITKTYPWIEEQVREFASTAAATTA